MEKSVLALVTIVLILAMASVPNALCYPPAGTDYINPTTATIELEIIGMFTETITVTGPTTVSRGMPYDPGDGHIKIDTEIISMNLVGTSVHIGPITIIESPSKASTGAIRQQIAGTDFPADSFFDVFVEIQTTLSPPVHTLHNDDPAIMNTAIDHIPPWGAIYTSQSGPIPLKDELDNIIGFIRHVSHEIPPKAGVDMMVGCQDLDSGGLGDVLGYRNNGSLANPSWERKSAWDINGIVGDRLRASPCFADLDDDGDYDLLISNAINVPAMGYKNVGNRTNPIWQRCSSWDVPSLGGYEQNPALADLDNDGDYDLCVGTELGHKACFFENSGNKSLPVWTRRSDWDFSPGVEWPSPCIVDIDGDGFPDLLFGSYTESYCAAWENTGTPSSPAWTRESAWDLTGLPANYHKKPAIADLDNDGDYDLMVGIGNHTDPSYSKIWAYENTGDLTVPAWTWKPAWDIPLPGLAWIRPAFANLNGIHDVAVKAVTMPARDAYPGWKIKATISNIGDYNELCNATAHLNDKTIGAHATPLPPETDDELDFVIPFEPDIDYYVNYTLRVEVNPIPGETVLANNMYIYGTIRIKIVGDINGDQKVDIKDLVLIIKAYASYPGHSKWNVQADLNGDGKVDIKDLVLTIKHFGEHYP